MVMIQYMADRPRGTGPAILRTGAFLLDLLQLRCLEFRKRDHDHVLQRLRLQNLPAALVKGEHIQPEIRFTGTERMIKDKPFIQIIRIKQGTVNIHASPFLQTILLTTPV